MKKWLLMLNLAFSMMGAGQIWLVQLSSYPLWACVGPKEFHSYHIAWWHSIWGPIFIPAGLSILCSVALFWFRPMRVSRPFAWWAVVLLMLTYGLTCLWWAPLMALIGATPAEFQEVFTWAPFLNGLRLNGKTQGQLYSLLMATHWLRVALVTAYAILLFWMALIGYEENNKLK